MITVSVNNEKKTFQPGVTIEQLLAACDYKKEKIAVAVNTEFVSRHDYAQHIVQNNDKVDILAPIQGG